MSQVDKVFTIFFAVYYVIGLPVAWKHIRLQKMTQSVERLPAVGDAQSMVVFTLATMWPLLLLAMFFNRSPAKRSAPRRDTSPANPMPNQEAGETHGR